VQFSLLIGALDSWENPVDRELLFRHLALNTSVGNTREVSLLILENSPRDTAKYARVGFDTVEEEVWSQVALEFWSVRTATMI
jgi:hypothetical protein